MLLSQDASVPGRFCLRTLLSQDTSLLGRFCPRTLPSQDASVPGRIPLFQIELTLWVFTAPRNIVTMCSLVSADVINTAEVQGFKNDLKWRFTKTAGNAGVYSAAVEPLLPDETLVLYAIGFI